MRINIPVATVTVPENLKAGEELFIRVRPPRIALWAAQGGRAPPGHRRPAPTQTLAHSSPLRPRALRPKVTDELDPSREAEILPTSFIEIPVGAPQDAANGPYVMYTPRMPKIMDRLHRHLQVRERAQQRRGGRANGAGGLGGGRCLCHHHAVPRACLHAQRVGHNGKLYLQHLMSWQ